MLTLHVFKITSGPQYRKREKKKNCLPSYFPFTLRLMLLSGCTQPKRSPTVPGCSNKITRASTPYSTRTDSFHSVQLVKYIDSPNRWYWTASNNKKAHEQQNAPREIHKNSVPKFPQQTGQKKWTKHINEYYLYIPLEHVKLLPAPCSLTED